MQCEVIASEDELLEESKVVGNRSCKKKKKKKCNQIVFFSNVTQCVGYARV